MSINDEKLQQPVPAELEALDFDEWRRLHEEDPELFDQYRMQMLNDLIDSSPESSKPRLKGLLFQMECESKRSKSPYAYNMRLSAMMMEMLDNLHHKLVDFCNNDEQDPEISKPEVNAAILPFRASSKDSSD